LRQSERRCTELERGAPPAVAHQTGATGFHLPGCDTRRRWGFEQAGITLIQMAITFVLNHPAITSAIIGPRTMEQLEGQLAAADVVLDAGVLDRIDEIVAPGTTVNPVDNSFNNPALTPSARRRAS